jgi:hypothetical protein
MPIIFPDRCKGTTAGALRELKRDGFTRAAGGWFSQDFLSNNLLVGNNFDLYLSKNEPLGEFMNKAEITKENIDNVSDAIRKASVNMVETAREANKQLNDASGKMRDGTEKLSVAIEKMMKIAGRADFANTVKITESFVSSLERLAELEEKGLLDKVMKAMSK